MRWRGRRESTNVEDRRRSAPATVGFGGGCLGLIVILVMIYLGADPMKMLRVAAVQQQQQKQQQAAAPIDPNDDMAKFVSVVLADTEDVWADLFAKNGMQYRPPKLVLFTGQVQSACGFQSAATGPFYCPPDETVYIDLQFYDQMDKKLGAPGDFAQAYVIAHEVGHHVQKLLGISDRYNARRSQVSTEEFNELTVRLELQADFYAGVWAHHAQQNWQILEEGDILEALNAASAIGDDRLQMKQQGFVVPESFTHGTSDQRVRWFKKGLVTGDMGQGDTFNTREL